MQAAQSCCNIVRPQTVHTHHQRQRISAAASCSSSREAGESSSRRAIAVSVSLLPLLHALRCSSALAADTEAVKPPTPQGNSQLGKVLRVPTEFLRARQKVNGGEKILAPVRASRTRLQDAEYTVGRQNIYEPNRALYREALGIIRSASLNCYGFEALAGDTIETRASLLQRNLRIGDACTFRLIAKNVVALLPASKKKLRADTLRQLDDLIKSYELLDGTLLAAWHGDVHAVEEVPQKLQFTIAQTNTFETLIERCLDLPPSNVAPSAISALSLERLRRSFGWFSQG